MIRVPRHIEVLSPYKPGKPIEEVQRELGLTDVVKLASNENPLGPSPLAVQRMTEHAHDLHYYPNGGLTLREALAHRHQLKTENVICGNGSESVLQLALRTFLDDGDLLLSCDGTFVGFLVLSQASGRELRLVPQTAGYRFDVEALAAAITPRTKIVYIANANNPTGTHISREEFEWFMQRVPEDVLVIFDEAYFEYSIAIDPETYPDSLQYRFDNVLTLRTFSKIYGIAGVRIGYGFAHSDIIRSMLKVKLPFEPGTLAQSAGLGALEDDDFLRRSVECNNEGIVFVTNALRDMHITVPRSVANFVMLDCASPANVQALYDALLHKGVITRPLGGFNLPHCLRISIGTPEQNRICMSALRDVLVDLPQVNEALTTTLSGV